MIVETNAPTAVTTVRVRRGEESTFASWLTRLNETFAASPGYMSAVVMPPVQPSQSVWVMVVLLTLVQVVMLELLYVSPLLQSLNLSVVTFIGNLLSVAALTWALVPWANRTFGWWLRPTHSVSPSRRVRLHQLSAAQLTAAGTQFR
jgi:antibiotic biosynthesis monooxygenase (ABM) superfamily enzyme